MRSMIRSFILLGIVACGSATSPSSTTLNVRLLDDAGTPAGRNHIIVSQSGKADVHSQSGSGGTATLRLAGGGTYQITVVPRNEYIGGTDLSKSVMVSDNGQASVDFTLHRAAISTAEQPPFIPVDR